MRGKTRTPSDTIHSAVASSTLNGRWRLSAMASERECLEASSASDIERSMSKVGWGRDGEDEPARFEVQGGVADEGAVQVWYGDPDVYAIRLGRLGPDPGAGGDHLFYQRLLLLLPLAGAEVRHGHLRGPSLPLDAILGVPDATRQNQPTLDLDTLQCELDEKRLPCRVAQHTRLEGLL